MKKLLPLMAVLALSVPAANANVLTSTIDKTVSVTKSVLRLLVVKPAQKVAGIVRNVTVGALNVTDSVITGADNQLQ